MIAFKLVMAVARTYLRKIPKVFSPGSVDFNNQVSLWRRMAVRIDSSAIWVLLFPGSTPSFLYWPVL